MCKDKVLMWLSGAAGLDALAHLANGFGWSWFNVSTATNWVLFVVFGLIAVVLGYMANCYSRSSGKSGKPMKKK